MTFLNALSSVKAPTSHSSLAPQDATVPLKGLAYAELYIHARPEAYLFIMDMIFGKAPDAQTGGPPGMASDRRPPPLPSSVAPALDAAQLSSQYSVTWLASKGISYLLMVKLTNC